jgi:signal transduction histidine kinase
VRLRLTLLYGALFLASGAALLTITYALVRHSSERGVLVGAATNKDGQSPTPEVIEQVESDDLQAPPDLPPELQAQFERTRTEVANQRAHDLSQLLVQSGIALGLMTVISIGLGWVMAGRVLRPLRTMTATTRRISEHNLHERLALEGPTDELKQLGDTIDGLLGRLETAFEAQRRFVANASHELRTPLTMMRTSLDVATGKPGPLPPEVNALEAKLREGLDRADHMLESFLALARAQHGALPEQAASLPGLVSAAIEDRGDAIAELGISVERELRDAQVTGSEALLSRMVDNVIDNAIRHNEPAGWVRVDTQTHADVARLVVDSGGPRLQESDVRALAQPFRRLGAERTWSENGVGLGLSIVSAIASAHGGRLELHARDQGGLRVLIELPAGRPA